MMEQSATAPVDVTGQPVRAQTVKAKAADTETPLEALASMAVVLVIGLFIFAFIFQNFEIPSGSMLKTLLIGDHVVVDRSTFAPPTKWAPFMHYRPVQRGDIIVFYKPHPEQPDLILVKRAIGLPGDRIHLAHGVLYRNGVAQQEPYAAMPVDGAMGDAGYDQARDDWPTYGPPPSSLSTALWTQDLPLHLKDGDVVVPDGMIFAMGDNRLQSADSRFWGFVPMENILGRPMFNYWSFVTPEDQEDKTSVGDRVSFFFHTIIHIFDGTRWSRTLHVIR